MRSISSLVGRQQTGSCTWMFGNIIDMGSKGLRGLGTGIISKGTE